MSYNDVTVQWKTSVVKDSTWMQIWLQICYTQTISLWKVRTFIGVWRHCIRPHLTFLHQTQILKMSFNAKYGLERWTKMKWKPLNVIIFRPYYIDHINRIDNINQLIILSNVLKMGTLKSDHCKRLITLTMITLSGSHFNKFNRKRIEWFQGTSL